MRKERTRETDYSRIIESLDEVRSSVSKISLAIFGNGKPDGSICYRMTTAEHAITDMQDRINRLFKTDDWRKDFIAGAIRSVATAVIAALILWLIKR